MIEILEFCDSEGKFSVPFQIGDHVCATDGRIAVAIHRDVCGYSGPFGDRPPTNFIQLIDCGVFDDAKPIPDVPSCGHCDNTGFICDQECDECSGLGVCECDMGHDHDCEECGGTGEIGRCECYQCRQSGVDIGGRLIATKYLRKLHNLPECWWIDDGKCGEQILRVRFAGGVGVVMPLSREWSA